MVRGCIPTATPSSLARLPRLTARLLRQSRARLVGRLRARAAPIASSKAAAARRADMTRAVYVADSPKLQRLGWLELHRDLESGALVVVPSLVSWDSPVYLESRVDGDVVVVTVKKRALNA